MPEKISFLFGVNRYLSSAAPAAPEGHANIVWQSDGESISAYGAGGGSQTPWTQNIDAAGYRLSNAGSIFQLSSGYHAWNLDDTSGSWRHVANGYGNAITSSSGDGCLRIYTSQNSSAGAVATLAEKFLVGPSYIWVKDKLVFDNANGERLRIWTGAGGLNSSIGIETNCTYHAVEANTVFRWYCGVAPDGGASAAMELTSAGVLRMKNASGERLRIYDAGGINHAFGIEASCMWSQVAANSVFRWYCGVAADGGVSAAMELAPTYIIFKGQMFARGLPTSSSGLGSGGIWRDAAAGNVLKMVP